MRKICIMVVVLVLMNVTLASALIIPTETTNTASSDGDWYGTTGFRDEFFLGPSDKEGHGFQFILNKDYSINKIKGLLFGFNDEPQEIRSGWAIFSIVKGTDGSGSPPKPVPDIQSLVYQSPIYTIPLNNLNSWAGESGLDLTLKKGDYWFLVNGRAQELGGGADFSGDTSLEFLKYRLEGSVVPEPSTMFLLGSGLIGGVFLRRRKS